MTRVFFRTCGKTYKEQHEAAYELLYAAVAFCGYSVSQSQLKKTEKGKPYFQDREDVFFSIAHSSEYAACVIADVPCGIDIEKTSQIKKKISDRYLGGATGTEALRRWTERESFGKLTGEGFFTTAQVTEDVVFKNFQHDDVFVSVCVKGCEEIFVYNNDFELINKI